MKRYPVTEKDKELIALGLKCIAAVCVILKSFV